MNALLGTVNAILAILETGSAAHRPRAVVACTGAEQRAIANARVVVHGDRASIELPTPLLAGPNHFLWIENCWMLEG